MSSYSASGGVPSGNLVTRKVDSFAGVDFSNSDTNLARSPDSLNMWKNYKNNSAGIETRPSMELVEEYDNTIFGLFFYEYGNEVHKIVHCGTKLYDNHNEIFTGMNLIRSQAFIFNNILYIKDGLNYLEYDGETIKEVEGTIPTTSVQTKEGGMATLDKVNVLTGLRKNLLLGDGKTTEFNLDAEDIDSDYVVTAVIDGITYTQGIDLSVNVTKGTITFNVAPPAPLTDGQNNIEVLFRKTIPGYRDRINKCRMLVQFDNRIFFSGNQDYPNTIFWTNTDDPRDISDNNYETDGFDLTPIKSMVPANNALWVFKEPSQSNTTVFYHNPVMDSDRGKYYPNTHSSIATGCKATGINFNDDIVFFSDIGMEAITGDITTEQVLSHRSSMVDGKLLQESNYKDMILEEWEGYLLVIIDNKIYLADSRQRYQNVNIEYEWYYWELSQNITCTSVKDGVLYLCGNNNVYKLTKTDGEISSYWTTKHDDFKYPQYQKTTNKRGGTAEVFGDSVKIEVRTDNNNFEVIDTYENTKGYVVYRIKKKKWKKLQLKFSSNMPFGLNSYTQESFVGGYVKR